jgi:predicted MFS family arabinose efflux permease
LIGREQLSEGYNKLDTSFSIANLIGPGLGGLLIQALTAPVALLANSATYLLSAATLALIRRPEPAMEVREGVSIRRIAAEIGEGLTWVFRHAVLRSQLLGLTVAFFGFLMTAPLILVFAYRTLHFSPALMGAIFAAEGVSSLAGLWASSTVVRRLGLGRTFWVTQVVTAGALLAVPLAQLGLPVFVMAATMIVTGFSASIQDLNQVTIRQVLTPDRLQGRMNATFRLFFWGSWPLASFFGGFLGDRLGPSTAIVIGGLIALTAALAIALSALGRLPQKSVAAVT